MSSKRGPKSKDELQAELKAMTTERNDYRGQLRRRETDFENRTRALHSAQVLKLTGQVQSEQCTARKSRGDFHPGGE